MGAVNPLNIGPFAEGTWISFLCGFKCPEPLLMCLPVCQHSGHIASHLQQVWLLFLAEIRAQPLRCYQGKISLCICWYPLNDKWMSL